MARTREIIKVFLGSPNDLREERRAAKLVVEHFNNVWSAHLGYSLELVAWEETPSAYGRPQDIINCDLEQCDVFIGMIWRRWGTQPDHSGNHTSGFEEEFECSIRKHEKTGAPKIGLFFKDVDGDLLLDPGDELKKALAFKEKIINEKRLLYNAFSDINELKDRLHLWICRFIQGLDTEREAKPQHSVAPPSQQDAMPAPEEDYRFLTEIISKMESDGGGPPSPPLK